MRKLLWRALLVLFCLLLVGIGILYKLFGFHAKLTKGGVGLAAQPSPQRLLQKPLTSLPRYDPDSPNPHQVRLQSRDLRALDLQDSLPDLLQANFDNNTQWPGELPDGFDPALFLEIGRNPGLGLRTLHEKGITGKGIGLAIIDQNLLVNHVEYADRLRLYEELHSIERNASMHGVAVASIAVGKTVGVAPEADLYYISDYFITANPLPWVPILSRAILTRGLDSKRASKEPAMDWSIVDFHWVAKGIARVLAINRDLPAARKIRVISIEIGWTPGQPGYEEAMAAVEQAKKEGVFVISSSLRNTHGMRFHGLGREPLNDPEDPASYYPITAWGLGLREPTLLIPMDARTTAAPTGSADYAFYRQGGWSWVAPYLAGLYALACQVKPDVTPELFWKKALETGDKPDLSKLPPISRAAVRKKQAEKFAAGLAEAKSRDKADEFLHEIKDKYRAVTGKTAPDMSEVKFQNWAIDWLTEEEMARHEGKEGRIINPPALIEALQQ